MRVIGIDPGPEMSAEVVYDNGEIVYAKYLDNATVMADCNVTRNHVDYRLAIEFPESRGKTVAQSVLDTAGWAGTFNADRKALFIKPREIRIHFCGTSDSTRAHVNRAIQDLFEARMTREERINGDSVGNKAHPGPLYCIARPGVKGISEHLWAALAVALCAAERGEK